MHVSGSFSSEQLHCAGSKKESLRVNKFVCCVGIFLLDCILISTYVQLWPPYYLLWHVSPDRYTSTVITLGLAL